MAEAASDAVPESSPDLPDPDKPVAEPQTPQAHEPMDTEEHRHRSAADNHPDDNSATAGDQEPKEATDFDPDTGSRLLNEILNGLIRFAAPDASLVGVTSTGEGSPNAGSLTGNVTQTINNIGTSTQRASFVQQVARSELDAALKGLILIKQADRPSILETLSELARRQRVSLLLAPSGSGRTTVAVHALHACLPEKAGLAIFRPGPDPEELRQVRPKPGGGYVIQIDQAVARRPVAEVLGEIDSLIGRSQAAAIVVTAAEVVPAEWHDRQVRMPMPNRERVFSALLEQVHGLAGRVDPAKLNENVRGASMAEIARAAWNVRRAVDEGLEDHAAYLRVSLRNRIALKFDASFEDQVPGQDQERGHPAEAPDAENAVYEMTFRRCCLLAAAVYDGRELAEVLAHARQLTQLVYAENVPVLAANPFSSPLAPLLAWLGAELKEGDTPASSRTLTFQNSAVPDVVLEHVWSSHHLAAQAVLLWLDALARHHSTGQQRPAVIRLRAAQVVGRLASYDFNRVIGLLESWIKRDSISGLEATAWAIQVMARDPQIATATWNRVSVWSRKSRSFRRAVLAIYAQCGKKEQTEEALALAAQMAELPTSTDYAAAMVLRRVSVVSSPEPVLDLLFDWHHQIAKAREAAARIRLTTYIRVESGLPTNAARSLVLLADAQAGGSRQALATRMSKDSAFADAVCELWRIALEDPAVTRRAAEVLEHWLQDSETDRTLTTATALLVQQLSTKPSVRRRMYYHSRRWIVGWEGSFPDSAHLLRRYFHVH